MSKRKYPEQRSATTQPQPGQAPAKPTGNEMYRSQAKAPLDERLPEAEAAQEELSEMEELQRAAVEAYERLGEAAERLSEGAVEAYDLSRAFVRDNPGSAVFGGFVVGVLLGFLSSGR